MNSRLIFLCGLAGGFVLKALLDARAQIAPPRGAGHDIRDAGTEQMENPPHQWDIVDEQGDESFPASDPPSNY